MSRRPFVLFGLTLLLSVACARFQVERAGDPNAPSVVKIQYVYLGDFRRSVDGRDAREILRAEIERRELFTVVESASEADGILDGEVYVRGSALAGGRVSGISGEARLMHRATGRLIWRHQFTRTRPAPYSVAPTHEGAIHWIVSQFCDELEMSAARGGE
jgi:hypothetical protein